MRQNLPVALAVLLLAAPAFAGDVEALARDVTADLAARAFSRVTKRFDAELAAALSEEKLKATWDSVVAQYGAFKSVKGVRLDQKEGYSIALVASQFEKGDLLITVTVDGKGQVAGLFIRPMGPPSDAPTWSPPPYAPKADALEEREVAVGPKKLPGTLTLPKGAGPFPAIVLVHGSGPNDRDESMGPNKVFKDLALGLAAKGVATLRYDKRTLKAPGEFSPSVQYTTKEEVTEDAREAVVLLTTTQKIDPRRVFVLGHSLGGTLAPRVAAEEPRVAGVLLLAGATRQMDVLVREQIKVTAPGNDQASAMVEAFSKRLNDPKLAATDVVDFLGARLPGSYLLDLRAYDPAKTAAALKVPVFVGQGQRDYQVTTIDFDAWKAALKGKKGATFKLYPALNHLFQEGTGPSTPAEYSKPRHVAEGVIADVVSFVTSK